MNPLSKSKAKYIKSLQLKKSRTQEGRFIVEGKKSVMEFLDSDFIVDEVVGTAEFYEQVSHSLLPGQRYLCSVRELSDLGTFSSNDAVLAIVRIKPEAGLALGEEEIILALDAINDPGNLGTIIRVADWYGIKTLLLAKNAVDIYNPKVVSASKGSLIRVNVSYVDLQEVLSRYEGEIIAADMVGEPLATMSKLNAGLILMGSESHGISDALEPFITKRITITGGGGAESLNVAVATGIICNHLIA